MRTTQALKGASGLPTKVFNVSYDRLRLTAFAASSMTVSIAQASVLESNTRCLHSRFRSNLSQATAEKKQANCDVVWVVRSRWQVDAGQVTLGPGFSRNKTELRMYRHHIFIFYHGLSRHQWIKYHIEMYSRPSDCSPALETTFSLCDLRTLQSCVFKFASFRK